MKNRFKLFIAKVVKRIIVNLFIEHTPPHVKYSEKNRRVAIFMLAIDDLMP